MPLSAVTAFMESGGFSNYMKGQEAQFKLAQAVMNRIDNVIRAIGSLGKLMARRR